MRKARQIGKCNNVANFWEKVQKSESGCWIWTAAKNPEGYGRIAVRGKMLLSHRFSYILHFGNIPEGMHVCHRCDTPSCVNPAHLFVGTDADNMRDCSNKGRNAKGEKIAMAKLRSEDIPVIRRMRIEGKTQKEIASLFGVNRMQVSRIERGIDWRHIKE
jgi:DNA-binding XRE family transcriptional regulator